MLGLIVLLLAADPVVDAPEAPAVPYKGPEVPPEKPNTVEELVGEQFPAEGPGGRWGVVSLAAGDVAVGMRVGAPSPLSSPVRQVQPTGLSAVVGMGARYGLRPRESERMWMPALSFMLGTAFTLHDASPFAEVRGEFMTVSPGGPLQPNFLVYGTTGLSTSPLGRGGNFSLQPHLGVGIGWNWFPKGGGGGGGGWLGGFSGGGMGGIGAVVAIPLALAIAAMVFAGRIELRYTARPFTGPGSDFVSVMIGVGS